MTEYLIFGVSYSKEEQHIEWVLLGRSSKGKMASYFIASRQFVADLIKNECASFRTATLQGKNYLKGAKVVIYDDEFLTTVPDATEKNNLERLPVFLMPEDEIDAALAVAVAEIFGSPV